MRQKEHGRRGIEFTGVLDLDVIRRGLDEIQSRQQALEAAATALTALLDLFRGADPRVKPPMRTEKEKSTSMRPSEIKRLRLKLGLSQKALGRKLGLSHSALGNAENGRFRLSGKSIRALRELESEAESGRSATKPSLRERAVVRVPPRSAEPILQDPEERCACGHARKRHDAMKYSCEDCRRGASGCQFFRAYRQTADVSTPV